MNENEPPSSGLESVTQRIQVRSRTQHQRAIVSASVRGSVQDFNRFLSIMSTA